MKSTNPNAELVKRFVSQVWNEGNFSQIDRFVAKDYEVDATRVGRDWIVNNVSRFRSAFPDLQVSIVTIVCEENQIAAMLRLQGTHLGDWRGFPASGERVDYREAAFWTVQNGLISRGEFIAESLTMRIQLGLLPTSSWNAAPQAQSNS